MINSFTLTVVPRKFLLTRLREKLFLFPLIKQGVNDNFALWFGKSFFCGLSKAS